MKKERNIYVKLFNVIFNSGIYTRTVTIGEMTFFYSFSKCFVSLIIVVNLNILERLLELLYFFLAFLHSPLNHGLFNFTLQLFILFVVLTHELICLFIILLKFLTVVFIPEQ
jgi:hypothetical protein